MVKSVFVVGLPVTHAVAPEIPNWPTECEGKTYCTTKPENYPLEYIETLLSGTAMATLRKGGMDTRRDEQDVGSCHSKKTMDPVYLIKDDNDSIRIVAQTEKFKTTYRIEECTNPGRIQSSEFISAKLLEEHRVDCYEKKVPIEFPVISLDGSSLESVSPKGGLSVSCTAKVIN